MVPTCRTARASSDRPPGWDEETDLLVFGSGAAGLAAAVYGRKKGLRVLLCEKTEMLGGTTATSGGVLWIPGSRQARAAGVADTLAAARLYLRHELANHYRDDLVDAFLESAAEALADLETGTEIAFDLSASPDYHPDQPGGLAAGRSVIARPFDGRRLGADFGLVRPPMPRLMVLGGMMVGPDDLPAFVRPLASLAHLRRVTRRVLRYAADRLSYPRGTEIANGNAFVARCLHTLRRLEATIWTEAPLVELIREKDRVGGAVVDRAGGRVRVRACVGVVLATGGFPRDADLRRRYAAGFPHRHTMAFEANTGDALRAAVDVGAAVDTAVASPGLWTPASVLRRPDGSEETIIYGYLDRGRPGMIAVDPRGRRFVNEANSYHDIVMAMYRHGAGDGARFHFVCDLRFVRKHGLGAIRPWPWTPNLRRYARGGYIQMADSLPGLAARIGVDASGLVATVDRHNESARRGVDPDFGKGDTAYNRVWGDPAAGPNPNLAPIERPPFVALRIVPATLGTVTGLRTDGHASVVDGEGRAIPGLFACGNDLASVMRGFYPGGGVTLGPAVVFAYRAVRRAIETAAAPLP